MPEPTNHTVRVTVHRQSQRSADFGVGVSGETDMDKVRRIAESKAVGIAADTDFNQFGEEDATYEVDIHNITSQPNE